MAPENNNFIDLYDKYADSIYRFIYMKVSDKDYAWDLTQDCFLKSFEYFNAHKVKNPRAFLYQVARNLVFDFWKERQKHSFVEISEVENAISDNFSAAERYDLQLQANAIMNAINKLPEHHRDLLILRYVDDLSFAEIASILGKNRTALRMQTSRLVRSLKLNLQLENQNYV